MSGLCGSVGAVTLQQIQSLLDVIPHRGDATDVAVTPDAAFGVRAFSARGEACRVHRTPDGGLVVCAGGPVPRVDNPAEALLERLDRDELSDLDGRFAVARWDAGSRTLTLFRDAFGLRSIYYTQVRGTFWFATELKQLLAIPQLPVAIDPVAIHKYLTFSFVPGEATPVAGIRRLLPGHVLTYRDGNVSTRPWFRLEEHIAPVEQGPAAKALWKLGRDAVERRLGPARPTGLYLSGGLDSSAVGLWLRDLGVPFTALTLDFGSASVEREEATAVAAHLGAPLEVVRAEPAEIQTHFEQLIWSLDLPFGDAVTGPHWLLARAAVARGIESVWNGEGGDQLFGGWTSKPMVAAAVFGPPAGDAELATPAEQYLKSYHRFYGLENELYSADFAAQITPGQRRAVIGRFLGSDRAQAFLNRVRLTDISLKGLHNILPRAERIASAHGLDLQMPLFDRRLAEWSFTLPPELKLHGACEKYVMKLAMQGRLPDEIVWRRKFGMSVPVTDWIQGPLRSLVDELLSDASVERRGLFQPAYVRGLRDGQDVASETRRRRLGERLWTLLVLEAWCRRFIDRRGQTP